MTDSKQSFKSCAAWMARQPEAVDDYLSFREQTLIHRLWAYRDGEAEVLRGKIRALEAQCAAQVLDLQECDRLVVYYDVPISPEQANHVRDLFERGLNERRRPMIMGGGPKFLVLRRATGARVVVSANPPET